MSVGRNLYESQYLFLIRCYFDIKVWPTLELCYNTYISVPRFHTSQSLSDISSASNIKACCCNPLHTMIIFCIHNKLKLRL